MVAVHKKQVNHVKHATFFVAGFRKNYRSIRNRKTENSWLLVPYSTKANHFCEVKRMNIQIYEPCSSQKRLAFVEYGTRSQEFSVFLFLIYL